MVKAPSKPGMETLVKTGWAALWNHTYHENVNSTYLVYPWYYYYKIIGNANVVIENIDEAEGTEAERNFYKAQALVFRAHAYTMLMQLYAYRWQDSGNGSGKGVVLRLTSKADEEGNYDLPLSTQAECYAQIYKDVDDAISLFQSSGMDRGSSEFYMPNINVAYAVKTRAALVREDWSTARPSAHDQVPVHGRRFLRREQRVDLGRLRGLRPDHLLLLLLCLPGQ